MHTFFRYIQFIAIFFIWAVNALAAPSAKIDAPPVYKPGIHGGTLRFSVPSDPKSFNPVLALEVSTTNVTNILFARLVDIDPRTFNFVPELLKSWEIRNAGQEWRFVLRDGLRWSDGKPLTTDDVAFSFEKLYKNKNLSANKHILINNSEIKLTIHDAQSFSFTLPEAMAAFLSHLYHFYVMPKHVLEPILAKTPFENTYTVSSPAAQIVGSGPFLLGEYVPSERLVLKRNPHYFKRDSLGRQVPYLDSLNIGILSNQDIALLKFQTGELDLYGLRGGDLRGSDFRILEKFAAKGKSPQFELRNSGPTFGTSFVVFNQNKQLLDAKATSDGVKAKLRWFRDLNFRKAFAHAISKKRLINEIMNGFGYEQNGPVSPSLKKYYFPDIARYSYDLKQARALLAKAGFATDKITGRLVDKAKRPVEFNLFTSSHSLDNIKICGVIREDLAKLGITVHFSPLMFNEIVTKLTDTFDFDAVLIGLTGSRDPYESRDVWTTSGNLHMWAPKEVLSISSWQAEIDQIFRKGAMELDESKRRALYNRWQVVASQQLPLIFTVTSAHLTAHHRLLGNFEPIPTPFGSSLHNIEFIYWQKPGK